MLRKYLPAILVGVVLGSIVSNIWIVRHSKQIANKISLQQSNKQIVLDFYKAQNQHASSALPHQRWTSPTVIFDNQHSF